MNIAIFTTFTNPEPSYSLNIVVMDQIKMLLRHNYKPVVIAIDGFKPTGVYEEVEIKTIPNVTIGNDGVLPDNYQDKVNSTEEILKGHLMDIDICITHDIIYQSAHLIYNVASRNISKDMTKLKWLHWIHSVTKPRIMCNVDGINNVINQPFPNSHICYPNAFDISRVASDYKLPESKVKHIPHPIDIPEYFGFSDLSKRFVDKYNILQADVIMVYPLRLDRGKQPEVNIKIISAIKNIGKSVRLIFMDFHSTGGDKVVFRKELRDLATSKGLSDYEVIFMSEFDPALRLESPRGMVKDMMSISNVFVLPSKSETYSLITQEAAVLGNFIVLNYDFPPMQSIFGYEPKYFKFSSIMDIMSGEVYEGSFTETKYHDENKYFDNIARSILSEVLTNRIVLLRDRLRKTRNLDYVFINYMEPVFNL